MRLIVAVGAAVLGYFYYRGQQVRTTHATVKDDLRRWEGEGGNDPAVATPSPAPVPTESRPYNDPTVRH
jgi:hypothetical protein